MSKREPYDFPGYGKRMAFTLADARIAFETFPWFRAANAYRAAVKLWAYP